MKASERRVGDVLVVDLIGELRFGPGLKLGEIVPVLLDRGEKRILINLARVRHFTVISVGELVVGYTSACSVGAKLRLRITEEQLKEFNKVPELAAELAPFLDEAEAIASFSDSPDR